MKIQGGSLVTLCQIFIQLENIPLYQREYFLVALIFYLMLPLNRHKKIGSGFKITRKKLLHQSLVIYLY